MSGPRMMKIMFLLPEGTNQFLRMLGTLIRHSSAQAASCSMRFQLETIRSFNPKLLARAVLSQGRKADAVAFMALEHPVVREAVDELADLGVPTVTLISDVLNSKRLAYIGLDNRSAGRSAALLMSRFIGNHPAKVALIAGSLSYRAHEDRELGFLQFCRELAPHIEVVGLREGHDDETLNFRQTRQLLSDHTTLAGIYNIGGGALGVGRALKDMRLDKKIIVVGHGLTADTRSLLIDGTMDAVITQSPRATLHACMDVFSNWRAGRLPAQDVEMPRAEIILRENLPTISFI